MLVHAPAAAAVTCTSSQQDTDVLDPATNNYGSQAYMWLPFVPILCGSGLSNGGYVAGTVVTIISTACGLGPYSDIESGVFYGTSPYGSNPSSGSDMAYYYLQSYNGFLDLCDHSFVDESSGSYYPSAYDNSTIEQLASPTSN
jgi:hypothetical protein